MENITSNLHMIHCHIWLPKGQRVICGFAIIYIWYPPRLCRCTIRNNECDTHSNPSFMLAMFTKLAIRCYKFVWRTTDTSCLKHYPPAEESNVGMENIPLKVLFPLTPSFMGDFPARFYYQRVIENQSDCCPDFWLVQETLFGDSSTEACCSPNLAI